MATTMFSPAPALASALVISVTLVTTAVSRPTAAVVQSPDTRTLTFYLHGDDIPGSADGYTMNGTPSTAQALRLNLASAPAWSGDPVLTGVFAEGAAFTLVKPCTIGLSVAPTYRLALTDSDGTEVAQLGQVTRAVGLCLGQERIRIPVQAPIALADQRLKLTISSPTSLVVNLSSGAGTYLQATGFVEAAGSALRLSASIEWERADAPPGPELTAGETIVLRAGVSNAGSSEARIREATSSFGPMACDAAVLASGQSTTCTATGIAREGPQEVGITVTGVGGGHTVTVSGLGHYTGVSVAHTNRIVTVADAGYGPTSIALDSAGNPVIAYYSPDSRLRLVHCGNSTCSAGNSIALLDFVGDSEFSYNSLALDPSGRPVVSYHDYTNGTLKLVTCGNPDCTAGNSIVTLDAGGNVGLFNSLVLASGGPVISYYDAQNGALKLLRCYGPDCSMGKSIVTVDDDAFYGETSLALDGDIPVISYYGDDQSLKVARCSDANCGSFNTNSIVKLDQSTADVGRYNSLVMDVYLPVIGYYDGINGNLKLARCSYSNCFDWGNPPPSIDAIDAADDVGLFTSLALFFSVATDTRIPVISYYDATYGNLKVLFCGDSTCAQPQDVTVDQPGDVGLFTSLVLSEAGRPVVSYYDRTNSALKLLRCASVTCD